MQQATGNMQQATGRQAAKLSESGFTTLSSLHCRDAMLRVFGDKGQETKGRRQHATGRQAARKKATGGMDERANFYPAHPVNPDSDNH
ncbi:MAG: hypothetical protein LBL13_13880 [Bacteroidales bacterium]|jgi:hypothetical protein|nr:hypothetical protein [Bacteroidales bacterium]